MNNDGIFFHAILIQLIVSVVEAAIDEECEFRIDRFGKQIQGFA
jgi:hypothetical protein